MANALLNSLVPRISKRRFDDEAKRFLLDTYPEGLQAPVAIPIEMIATKVLGLTIREEYLTEDLSILGEMCFTDGKAEIYDPVEDEYREILVKAGTMLIDPNTYYKRHIGSKRNTIAHECFHWTRHRFYYIEAARIERESRMAFRCPATPKNDDYTEVWTDEDWMEWQANNIAPRILMPKETVGEAVDQVLEKGKKNPFFSQKLIPQDNWIVEQIAGVYQVSRQAAEIRLSELGYIG